RRGRAARLVHRRGRRASALRRAPDGGGERRGRGRAGQPGSGGPAGRRADEARPVSASLSIDRAVGRLAPARPDSLNPLHRHGPSALEEALKRLERAADVTVVIVSGRGRAFCAGNDIAEMPTLAPAEAQAVSRRWQAIMDRFARLPQVTIAAVRGYALGG